MTPVTALADRKNALAAAMSRFSLSLTSTSAPEHDRWHFDKDSHHRPFTLMYVSVNMRKLLPIRPVCAAAGRGVSMRVGVSFASQSQNRLIAEFDAPDQEHLWQIPQAQLVAKPPKDHECDDVGWILSAIENSTAAFIELLTTGAAPEASVTPGRPLTSFRHVRRVTIPLCTALRRSPTRVG